MTIARLLLLLVITLSPLTTWGQMSTSPRATDALGNEGQLAMESGNNPGFGPIPGSPAAFAQDQGAMLPSPMMRGQGPNVQPQFGAGQPAPQVGLPSGPLPAERHHYTSPIYQSTGRGGYFGIMGAILEPGVYYHKTQRMTLGELVELSGGTTPEASGGVRIVRQGRGGLQTFFSPNSGYELLNGDVVWLESPRLSGQAGLRQFSEGLNTAAGGVQRSKASSGAPSKPGPKTSAYLAFVNLTPQPIIVPVPADQATLTTVLTWLRQDVKTPPFVRVISPTPQLHREQVLSEELLLESGTVLVFDPATIKRERLPEFPAVIGASEAASVVSPPPAAANPAPAAPKSIPEIRPATPRPERPAGRATRTPPAAVPPPPSEAELQPIRRREVGQQDPVDQDENRSAFGGPVLMMPQNNRMDGGNPQATGPDFKPNSDVSPEIRGKESTHEASAAEYRERRVSWQSRPSAAVSKAASEELDKAEVLQAHAEQELAPSEVRIGPALELPGPIPKLAGEPALIQPQSEQLIPTEIRPVPSMFRRQMVWISVAAMSLMCVMLWLLFRWDGRRPVHARVLAGRKMASGPGHDRQMPIARQGRSVLMAERQQIFRTDIGGAQPELPTAPAAASPEAVKTGDASLSSLPPPIQTISQREHALRAHFRQAWQERGQRPAAPETATATAAEVAPSAEAIPAPHIGNAPAVRAPASPASKSQDVLERALHVKRGP